MKFTIALTTGAFSRYSEEYIPSLSTVQWAFDYYGLYNPKGHHYTGSIRLTL